MSLSMPITKERIKNHFQYSAWKYALLVALTLFFVNLICTMTAYRIPEELKIEFYADQYQMSGDKRADELMEKIRAEVMPDMEKVSVMWMSLDSTYGDMQLMTWMAAGEGDVYMMDQKRFENMASEGAMLDLQPLINEGRLNVEGLSLEGGYVRDDETGVVSLRGIPAEQLAGFVDYGMYPQGQVLSIMAACGNEDNAVKFLDYLITNLRESKPVEPPAEGENP